MISNIPTDSFYKFCAILGTILIIFNSYYNIEKQNEIENDLTTLLGDIHKNRYYIKKESEKNKRFIKIVTEMNQNTNEDLKYWRANIKAKNSGALSKQELELLNEQINELDIQILRDEIKIDSIQNIIDTTDRNVTIASIDIETNQSKVYNKKRKFEKYKFYLRIGAVLGIILFIYGFINWFKIQKVIDRNMKNGSL